MGPSTGSGQRSKNIFLDTVRPMALAVFLLVTREASRTAHETGNHVQSTVVQSKILNGRSVLRVVLSCLLRSFFYVCFQSVTEFLGRENLAFELFRVLFPRFLNVFI